MEEGLLQDKINALGSDTIMGSMEALNNETRDKIEKLQAAVEENIEQEESDAEIARKNAITGNTLDSMIKAGYIRKTRPIVRDNKKIGRNDPCPCGSGKKYKDCCLNTGRYETTHYV